jgi:hypothetical protein
LFARRPLQGTTQLSLEFLSNLQTVIGIGKEARNRFGDYFANKSP